MIELENGNTEQRGINENLQSNPGKPKTFCLDKKSNRLTLLNSKILDGRFSWIIDSLSLVKDYFLDTSDIYSHEKFDQKKCKPNHKEIGQNEIKKRQHFYVDIK